LTTSAPPSDNNTQQAGLGIAVCQFAGIAPRCFQELRNNPSRRQSAQRLQKRNVSTARRSRLAVWMFRSMDETPMGLFAKDIKTMNGLFVRQLQDIQDAVQQLVKAPPKMAEKTPERSSSRTF
jgi:hypothetical protein